jgi:tetratricopeptide (TPR) repeat protein
VRLITLILMCSVAGVLHAGAQSAEHEAIKQMLRAETAAFFARDAEAWQAHWLHDPNTTGAVVGNNRYLYMKGWEEVAQRVARVIKANPKPVPVDIANTNFLIRQQGDMAWVEYDSVVRIDADRTERSHEYRAVVKTGGQWRIVSQVSHQVANFGSSPEAIEANLNATGYLLLEAGRPKDAIEVLRVNVTLFPSSWNAYDSLGEAYAATGQTDFAIQNYEKSVQLNPKNDAGKAALAKLKGR